MNKNVIFDLGRVLIDWNPNGYLNKYVKDQEKIDAMFKEIFGSQEWQDLDRGTIKETEAIRRFKERCPNCHKEIDNLFENIIELIPPLEKNIGLFEEVASKYNTYILSNFGERTFALVFEKYPWFKLFDGKIVSAHVKLLKPEKEIYEALISKYSLNPDECIFIDDTHANIIASEKMGIKGVHYTGEQELREMLKKYIELN